jgi:hypothetical protein
MIRPSEIKLNAEEFGIELVPFFLHFDEEVCKPFQLLDVLTYLDYIQAF